MCTTRSSFLLELPKELLDHIVSYLSKADLLNLRLVNKEVSERTEKRVLSTAFETVRGAFWLPSSLYNVRSALTNSITSAHIWTITIHIDRPILAEGEDVRHCVVCCSECDILEKEYTTFIHEMRAHSGPDGTPAVYLRQIFEHLKERTLDQWWVFPAINIRSKDDEPSPLERLNDRFGSLVSYERNDDASATIRTILDAMSAVSLQPGTLDIGSAGVGVPVKMFRSPSVFCADTELFSRVAQLGLHIQIKPVESDGPRRDADVIHLVDFLKAMRHRLTLLWLTGQHNNFASETSSGTVYSNEMAFHALHEQAVVFPNLMGTALRFVTVDQRKLIDFLARHKGTLKRIWLTYVYIGGPEVQAAGNQWKQRFHEQIRNADLPPVMGREDIGLFKWTGAV